MNMHVVERKTGPYSTHRGLAGHTIWVWPSLQHDPVPLAQGHHQVSARCWGFNSQRAHHRAIATDISPFQLPRSIFSTAPWALPHIGRRPGALFNMFFADITTNDYSRVFMTTSFNSPECNRPWVASMEGSYHSQSRCQPLFLDYRRRARRIDT